MERANDWAIVLAAGEGRRLAGLTTSGGKRIPKQFWSVHDGRSLLADALLRAARTVSPRRVVAVVAEDQRALWEPELARLAPEAVVVQPCDRGTAPGLLLPLLSILRRDPSARVVVVPSDHFVEKEYVLTVSLRLALESLGARGERIVLLGILPDGPEQSYGWIVPAHDHGTLQPVASFVEKPDPELARELHARGGVWNSFLLVAEGRTLLARYRERLPELLSRMETAMGADDPAVGAPSADSGALERLYRDLASADFARDVLQGSERHLWLMRVAPCGWTDLGTPERVAACVARLEAHLRRPLAPDHPRASARYDLAAAVQGSRPRPGRALGVA